MNTTLKFFLNSPLRLMYRIGKTTTEYCRVGFVLTALSEGIYDVFGREPVTCEDIQKALGSDVNQEGLEAWLDLGVSLGELKKGRNGYSLKGALSKGLRTTSNDAWLAYLQSRADVFYDYVVKTPSMIRENKRFEFNESYGELFARSSRTVEPLLYELVDKIVPRKKPCRLLEVGCGSGIYIKHACDLNPELSVVGLERQANVADFARKNMKDWNLEDRVTVEAVDVREHEGKSQFDLVTFYNLIYYFPVDERTQVLQCLGTFLKPGGVLVLTTLCQGRDPSFHLMNLWTSMTEGCGPLPYPKQITKQLKNAGFKRVESKTLIPGYKVFKASC